MTLFTIVQFQHTLHKTIQHKNNQNISVQIEFGPILFYLKSIFITDFQVICYYPQTILTQSSNYPHTVLTQSSHMPYTVLALSSHSSHTILPYALHSPHIILTQSLHYPHTVLTLSSHIPYTVLTLSSHSSHIILTQSSHSPHTILTCSSQSPHTNLTLHTIPTIIRESLRFQTLSNFTVHIHQAFKFILRNGAICERSCHFYWQHWDCCTRVRNYHFKV